MGLSHYGSRYIRRQDPKGRDYYWSAPEVAPETAEQKSDLTSLYGGYVTVTPLHFNLTESSHLSEMESWGLKS